MTTVAIVGDGAVADDGGDGGDVTDVAAAAIEIIFS